MSDKTNNPFTEEQNDKTPDSVNTENNIPEEESTIFSAPTKKITKAEEEKSGKKKNRKGLKFVIIAVVLALVLAGGTFAVLRFVKKDDPSATSSSTTSIPVYDYSSYAGSKADTEYLNLGGVTSIDIKNNSAHYVTEPTEVISSSTDATTGEAITSVNLEWNITNSYDVDLSGVDISSTMVKYAVGEVLIVSGFGVYAEDVYSTIPSGEKTYFSECGFEKPQGVFEVKFAEGSSFKLYVGDETPTKDGYFIFVDAHPNKNLVPKITVDGETIPILGQPKEDNRVYKVSKESLSFALADFNTLVERQIVEQVSNDNTKFDAISEYYSYGDLLTFDNVSLTSKAIGTTFNFGCVETATTPGTSNIYFVGEPENFNPDTDRVDELMSPLTAGLRANNCYELRADETNKIRYGFNDPLCTVKYKIGSLSVGLTVAKGIEDNYYAVMVDSKPSIYMVSADDLKFVNTTKEQWRDTRLYSSYITNVESMDMRVRDDDGNVTSVTFNLKHSESSNTDDSLTVTTSDGKKVSTSKFRDMYANLVSTSIQGDYSNDGTDSANPKILITMHYVGYTNTDVLRYSDYSARRYYFTVNGKNGAPVLSTLVDSIVNSFNEVMKTAN